MTAKIKTEVIKIVHLEDHDIFHQGLKNYFATQSGKYCFYHISQSEAALDYILHSLEDGDIINLVITDYNHPGINGYEFAKRVKELARDYNVQLPVLSLSMLDSKYDVISKGLKEGVYDQALPKNATWEELISSIENLVGGNERK